MELSSFPLNLLRHLSELAAFYIDLALFDRRPEFDYAAWQVGEDLFELRVPKARPAYVWVEVDGVPTKYDLADDRFDPGNGGLTDKQLAQAISKFKDSPAHAAEYLGHCVESRSLA